MIATVGEFASEFLGWEAGERRRVSLSLFYARVKCRFTV